MPLKQDWFLEDLPDLQNVVKCEFKKSGESQVLLTVREVAEKLRVSERTVRRLIANGFLEVQPIGGRILVVLHSLESYLESERQKWLRKRSCLLE